MIAQRRNPAGNIIKASWLVRLAEDYKVSPVWFLRSKGEFYMLGFVPEIVKKL